jgi:hypothetical protein
MQADRACRNSRSLVVTSDIACRLTASAHARVLGASRSLIRPSSDGSGKWRGVGRSRGGGGAVCRRGRDCPRTSIATADPRHPQEHLGSSSGTASSSTNLPRRTPSPASALSEDAACAYSFLCLFLRPIPHSHPIKNSGGEATILYSNLLIVPT